MTEPISERRPAPVVRPDGRADPARAGSGYADSLADTLLARIAARSGDAESPGDNYRRLLSEALAAAADAQAELRARAAELARLRRLSVTDETTGVLNRRGFRQALERALARLDRTGETSLLLVVDLDGFKAVNDTHGHAAGDHVLAAVAALLAQRTRATDAVGRIGGDEFAVVLDNAGGLDGRTKAARLRTELCDLTVPWQDRLLAVRASVGVVGYDAADSADDIIHRADLDMYAVKRMTAAASPAAANAGPGAPPEG